MGTFVVLSLMGGLLAVDDRAGWQSLLAQPVFAAVLVGAIAGDIHSALAVGLILELIWLSILPMRGVRRPDHIVGAVVGAGTASLLVELTVDPRVSFLVAVSVLVGLIAGEIAGKITSPLSGLHNRFLSRFEFEPASTYRSVRHKLTLLLIGSMAYIFIVEGVVVFIFLKAGFAAAEQLTRVVNGAVVDGAGYWLLLLPAVGAGSLVHLNWHQNMKRILALTAALAALILWLR